MIDNPTNLLDYPRPHMPDIYSRAYCYAAGARRRPTARLTARLLFWLVATAACPRSLQSLMPVLLRLKLLLLAACYCGTASAMNNGAARTP
eukprot:COSAG01_NODE_63277_length_280_cov_1.674033_1_plen_90_part_01